MNKGKKIYFFRILQFILVTSETYLLWKQIKINNFVFNKFLFVIDKQTTLKLNIIAILKNYHSITFSYFPKICNAFPLLFQASEKFESICSALS